VEDEEGDGSGGQHAQLPGFLEGGGEGDGCAEDRADCGWPGAVEEGAGVGVVA
jgi:hypothetical protein